MTKRIDNPWWSEGWRLVRARLPEVVTPRRRRVLAVVVVASVLVGILAAVLLSPAIDDVDNSFRLSFMVLLALLVVQIALGVCFIVWGRQDREPDFRAGRVSLGLEDLFALDRPIPAVSAEVRQEALVHVDRMRRGLPATIVSHGFFQIFLIIALVVIAFSGWWSSGAFIFLVAFLVNAWQPIWFLKLLGSTTAQLRRIEAAPEPPTYRGPKAWGIEAARKATEGDASAG